MNKIVPKYRKVREYGSLAVIYKEQDSTKTAIGAYLRAKHLYSMNNRKNFAEIHGLFEGETFILNEHCESYHIKPYYRTYSSNLARFHLVIWRDFIWQFGENKKTYRR